MVKTSYSNIMWGLCGDHRATRLLNSFIERVLAMAQMFLWPVQEGSYQGGTLTSSSHLKALGGGLRK